MGDPWRHMRDSIIGLGADSSRRTYYPELRAQVAELEEARGNLRRSEENLSTLFNSLHDAVIVHDGKGRVLEVNDAMLALFGVTQENVREYTLEDYSAPPPSGESVRDRLQDIWLRVAREGHHVFEWRGRRPLRPGADFDVEVSLRRMVWYGQDAVVAVVRDVSERKRLEAMLHQAQKLDALGQLAGGVAHDTNNMLGVILGYVELLLEEAPGGAARGDLEQIRKAALHSAELIRQLLAFARKQAIQPVEADLNELVEGTQKMLRRLIGEQHNLVWRPATALWPVHVDPGQVDQILANLVVNARDALGPGGTITLETANVHVDEAYAQFQGAGPSGDHVVLTVTDTGSGMSPEVMARIFEPFFTTKALGRGTGLGLATVYGIVRQHRGFITVYSDLGVGTTFRVHLPRYTGGGGAARVPPEGPPPGGHETVLLVEDEPALLEMGRRLLESAGYRVLAAPRPLEALRLVREEAGEIHLLATDLVMPDLNGWELYERVHALRPAMRALFISGYPAGTLADGPGPGGRFLQKPFSRALLLRKVREVLDDPALPPGGSLA